jgi:hypothetical protein
MNNNKYDIGDDEIRVLGNKSEIRYNKAAAPRPKSRSSLAVKIAVPIVIVLFGVLLLLGLQRYSMKKKLREWEEYAIREKNRLDSIGSIIQSSTRDWKASPPLVKQPLARAAETGYGFIEMADTVINDVPMRLYLPHQVSMSLYVGAIDRTDKSILFATQAADVRADNGGIVGAFILKGEPLAWGQSKKGYCAIINDTVTVGVAENSPLFEEATEKEGYFFRQFPLVDNGKIVENEMKGKNIRRALCDRGGEILIVETLSSESLHDFAQALADLGVDQAIYLLGGIAYGWATDAEGHRHEFGNPDPPKKKWENISYLVMRNKD